MCSFSVLRAKYRSSFPQCGQRGGKRNSTGPLRGVMVMIDVSVDRSGEKRSHAQPQTISAAGLTGSRMMNNRRMAHARPNGQKSRAYGKDSTVVLAGVGFVATDRRIC
jgi:hypothetical protein